MIYCALAGRLVEYPLAIATAPTVSEADTVIGPVYGVELAVGSEPFVV